MLPGAFWTSQPPAQNRYSEGNDGWHLGCSRVRDSRDRDREKLREALWHKTDTRPKFLGAAVKPAG